MSRRPLSPVVLSVSREQGVKYARFRRNLPSSSLIETRPSVRRLIRCVALSLSRSRASGAPGTEDACGFSESSWALAWTVKISSAVWAVVIVGVRRGWGELGGGIAGGSHRGRVISTPCKTRYPGHRAFGWMMSRFTGPPTPAMSRVQTFHVITFVPDRLSSYMHNHYYVHRSFPHSHL